MLSRHNLRRAPSLRDVGISGASGSGHRFIYRAYFMFRV